jgi:hypothetical protein
MFQSPAETGNRVPNMLHGIGQIAEPAHSLVSQGDQANHAYHRSPFARETPPSQIFKSGTREGRAANGAHASKNSGHQTTSSKELPHIDARRAAVVNEVASRSG